MKDNGYEQLELEAAYKKYHDSVYKNIYVKVLHKEIAEDLTSQVFLKVVKNYDRYDAKKSSVTTWINHITQNTVIDYYRTQKKDMGLLNVEDYEEDLIVEFDWFKRYEKKLLMQTIGNAVQRLRLQEREMILLKYFKCQSNREIARIYGLNESTVSTQLFRAVRKLRACVVRE